MANNPLILLVEDNDVDALIVNSMLSNLLGQFEIIRLKNGAEAADFIKDTDNKKPDIILLDLSLPYMDGMEFLSDMAQNGLLHRLPIIVLSSSNSNLDKQLCEDFGVMKYFSKPLTTDISKAILQLADVA